MYIKPSNDDISRCNEYDGALQVNFFSQFPHRIYFFQHVKWKENTFIITFSPWIGFEPLLIILKQVSSLGLGFNPNNENTFDTLN